MVKFPVTPVFLMLQTYVFNAGISSYLSDTLMFSKYVGDSGRVFCFEPEPCEFAWAKIELKSGAGGGGVESFALSPIKSVSMEHVKVSMASKKLIILLCNR
jgi:hypothetical protein